MTRWVSARSGLPQIYYEEMSRTWRQYLLTFAISTPITFCLALSAIWQNGSVMLASTAVAIWLWLTIGMIFNLVDLYSSVSLMLYFERKVGEIDTFMAGGVIARTLIPLDDVSRVAGLTPISAFGFNDDLLGKPLIWHDADEGLRTVNGLLDRFPFENMSQKYHHALTADLRKWRHALERAGDQQIRFCVLLRLGSGTSGQEWSVRKGTAF